MICRSCKINLNFSFFDRNPSLKTGFSSQCKKCKSIEAKIRRSKFKDRYKIKNKDKYYKNLEQNRERGRKNYQKNKEQRKLYYLKNKNKILQKNKEYSRIRRHIDLNYRLCANIRNRLNIALKNNQKFGSAVQDLGCTIDELKIHLESKWKPGMNWDNWKQDGWHIDHIIPLSLFDLTNPEDFFKAVHFSNLQPLWAKENLAKSNKIDYTSIRES